ncbi:hypothetical protein [Enterobacter cloacae]|uniref:hypothetical protein n=1 Tax=Enterobacter cloacae TaxID=550 RepID=UPI00317CF324
MTIRINIAASLQDELTRVSYGGVNVALISETERRSFNLNDTQLKRAAGKMVGREPNDAYLREPTPWKLYDKYRWMQTQRCLFIRDYQILESESKPVIVAKQEFDNSSSVPAVFDVSIQQSVENTVSSSWETGGTLSVGQSIYYQVGFLGTEAGGETTISYEQSWGIGGEKSTTITVGTNAGVEVELQPGQGVYVELIATRGTKKIKFNYIGTLEGVAALNYNPQFNGRHFYGANVPQLMAKSNIRNVINSSEIIEIGFFVESKIVVKDKKTHKVIKEFDCDFIDDWLVGGGSEIDDWTV